MVMSIETVKRILARFKQNEIEFAVGNWSVLDSENFDVSAVGRAKRKLISVLLEHIKTKKITKTEVAELDLLYVSEWPVSRKWTVFKLIEMPGSSCSVVGHAASDFRDQLSSGIQRFRLHCHVHVMLRDEGFWMRIEVAESHLKTLNVNGAVYVVYYSTAPYVYIANLRPRYADYILQALGSIFNCKDISKMSLEGRCVRSLQHIVTAQNGQDLPRSVAERLAKCGQKRKRDEINQCSVEHDDRIYDEDAASKRQCRDYIASKLGTGPQPALETLQYKLLTKFAGTAHVPNLRHDDKPFQCQVKLEGVSVIEGIRQMMEAGVTDAVLPNYLANIKNLHRNKILIRPRSTVTAAGS